MGKGSKPKRPKAPHKALHENAPHPMSAGERERNGRRKRDHGADKGTPELRAQLRKHGPTCRIQWLVAQGWLTQPQGDAVERFKGLRAAAGLAGRTEQTALRDFVASTGGTRAPDEVAERAMERLRKVAGLLDARERDAVITLCQAALPQDVVALRAAAAKLERFFIIGPERAD